MGARAAAWTVAWTIFSPTSLMLFLRTHTVLAFAFIRLTSEDGELEDAEVEAEADAAGAFEHNSMASAMPWHS